MEEFLQQERHAKINGWAIVDNSKKLYQKDTYPITLRKGNTYIWMYKNGWQVADLVVEGRDVGGYVNHRPEKTLAEAIDNNS